MEIGILVNVEVRPVCYTTCNMPDLIPDLLPRLHQHRIPDLALGEGFILPHYNGLSILNLPASICQILDVPPVRRQPLPTLLLEPLGDGIRRVVVLLVDALALHRLQRWMEDGTAPVWKTLVPAGVLAPITSMLPSTTSTCLPTLWSGLSPLEHGMVGYELWLKEYGVVANMVKHAPFTIESPGSLEKAGFKPETALPGTTLGRHLATHGVATYAYQHHSITRSGLSRMFLGDARVRPYGTLADLFISLRQLLEFSTDERFLAWAYWSELDYTGHNYGPDHERCTAEFAHFSTAFERHFLNQLTPDARQGTLLILTADHGQITTPKDPFYDLKSHPDLARRLHILPTGENRVMYLFIRPGQTEAVRAYLDRTFHDQFVQLDPQHAARAGLFGPGQPHPRLADRTGDLMVVARGNAYLWWAAKENPIYGRHGGLSSDEMLVPFLVTRLDG